MEAIPTKCIACGFFSLSHILSLGTTPLADRLLTKDQLQQPELKAPLNLFFCPRCSLVQIKENISPEILFDGNYRYLSSKIPSVITNAQKNGYNLMKSKNLDANSLVIEIASNDGYLLRFFKEKKIPILGIEPSKLPAEEAEKIGIPTIKDFFGIELAKALIEQKKYADIIVANNVLAHVPDLNGFVKGISMILKQNGIAVIEIPYLVNLIELTQFDTIYHQHRCYFSVTALDILFRRHGMFINAIVELPTQGGSLRLYIQHKEHVMPSVKRFMRMEQIKGVKNITYYQDFATRVLTIKTQLMQMLTSIKEQGKQIVGYGAAAKGNTLMSYCGIDKNHLDYIADINPMKHGCFMSGNHLPIYSTKRIAEDEPDYLLILAWNYVREILEQEKMFRKKGGKFIVPIPTPKII